MPALDAELVERSLRQLRTETLLYAHRVLGSWDDAEDAVQAAQVKAWRYRHKLTGSNLRPWLFLMTKRACIDVMRKERNPATTALSMDACRWLQEICQAVIDSTPTAEERLLAECVNGEMAAALRALPTRAMRAAVALVYLQGLEVAEAARRLGVSNHAVAMQTWKARTLLKSLLGATAAQETSRSPSPASRAPRTKNAAGRAS